MGRNTNSGYGDSIANGTALPIWLKDPFYRQIHDEQPHQVRP